MAVDYNRIGKRIAELRKSRGMTQASLAEKAEITNNFLSHIERSYSIPSLETLVRICDALGVTPDAVLLGTATEQSAYLADEFTGKFQACTPAQKRFILDMMDALNRGEPALNQQKTARPASVQAGRF